MKKYNLYSKSNLPDADYVINPYIGCTHGCMYCYACFMGRFSGHKEPWGSYLEVKEYASVRLPKIQENKTILAGSVTDAYNPAEKKYARDFKTVDAISGTCRNINKIKSGIKRHGTDQAGSRYLGRNIAGIYF